MISQSIWKEKDHEWIVFGRDPDKPEKIIDTNQYLVKAGKEALLMDPGGIELFAPMLAEVSRHVPLDQLTHFFASHQDPDIISSLGMWDRTCPTAKLYAPGLWEGFLRHFGCEEITFMPIADQGGSIRIGGRELQFIPAHYMHSSANFNVYDPEAKLLMSGDVGAALLPPDAPIVIEDFDYYVEHMRFFHQRWMPSNAAKNDWIARIRNLEVDKLMPQHGAILEGDNVARFLDWFEALRVGIAIGGNTE